MRFFLLFFFLWSSFFQRTVALAQNRGVTREVELSAWESFRQKAQMWYENIFLAEQSVFFDLKTLALSVWAFALDNIIWLGLVVFVVIGSRLCLSFLKEQYFQKYRLWVFLRYFLGKRHMILPTVIDLASVQEGFLPEWREKALTLREACQCKPLRTHKTERLEHEKDLSRLFFELFTHFEQNGTFEKNKKLQMLAQDLEFIDEKLTSLQGVYNEKALAFNERFFDRAFGVWLMKWLKLKRLPTL